MLELTLREDEEAVVVVGPAGEARLGAGVVREPEAPGRDRVTVEWTWRMRADDRKVQVVFAYAHDSYDGEHRLVLEDGYACEASIQEVLTAVGARGTALDFVQWAAGQSELAADALETLAEQVSRGEHVGSALRGPEL